MKTFRISKKDLETVGGNYLWGMLANYMLENKLKDFPEEVRFEFEQSSMSWKSNHNGPDSIVITEHVPMCLCADIASLSEKGIKIQIGEYINDA